MPPGGVSSEQKVLPCCHRMGLVTLLLGFLSSSLGRSPKKTLRPHNWSFISIFPGGENLGLKQLETRFFAPTPQPHPCLAPPTPAPGARSLRARGNRVRIWFPGCFPPPAEPPACPAPVPGPRESGHVNCSRGLQHPPRPAPRVTPAFSWAAEGPAGRAP